MHLHGHHMLVFAHDGLLRVPPFWVDTLDIRSGETYDVAVFATNPGRVDVPLPHPPARRERSRHARRATRASRRRSGWASRSGNEPE